MFNVIVSSIGPIEFSLAAQGCGINTLRLRCVSAKPVDVQFEGNKDWLSITSAAESTSEGESRM